MCVHGFLCSAVLCRQRPVIPTKCLNGFRDLELHSESEHVGGQIRETIKHNYELSEIAFPNETLISSQYYC
jgi:hypothetical protein